MERNAAPPLADLSFPELLRSLSTDTSALVRQELALARSEVLAQIEIAKTAGIAIGAAALLGLGAFGAITLTLIEIVHLALPLWAAALIVAIVYAAVAAAALARVKTAAVRASGQSPARSVESVRDDVDAVRAGISRGR